MWAERVKCDLFFSVLIISLSSSFGGPEKTGGCEDVKCGKAEGCPPDSYRLPWQVETHHPDCCPMVGKCQCHPQQLCPQPECPAGWTTYLVRNASGQPGNCCPIQKCSPPTFSFGESWKKQRNCSYGGELYGAGESWLHLEDCTDCLCSPDGVVTCQKIQCGVIPKDCGLARAPPNSCCPLCVGCVTSSGKVYNNSQVWEEDACTQCECDEGKVKCYAALCGGAECENPIQIPGECCPRCAGKEEGENHFGGGRRMLEEGKIVTGPRQNTGEVGQQLRGNPGLSPCKVQDEKLGWVLKEDEEEWNDGCRFCLCRRGKEMCTLVTCSPPQCEHPVFFPGDCCPRCPDEEVSPTSPNTNLTLCPSGKSHGDFWNLTHCLICTCHHGLTLCSHPACPPTPCEAPEQGVVRGEGGIVGEDEGEQNEGDISCCSQCPPPPSPPKFLPSPQDKDEEVNKGEMGVVPPLGDHVHHDDNGSLTTRSDTGGRDGGGDQKKGMGRVVVNNKNSITTSTWNGEGEGKDMEGKRNCFSDDSHTEYSHGDTWRVSPCQSCVCHNGRIECFSSSGHCPRFTCDRPILAKNQCCPACLDGGLVMDKKGTKGDSENGGTDPERCRMNGWNETWAPGQSWSLDKCTRCVCIAPLVQCTRTVCSISCKEPLIHLKGECCPICPNDDGKKGNSDGRVNGHRPMLGPYCFLVIAALVVTSTALAYYILRFHYHRPRQSPGGGLHVLKDENMIHVDASSSSSSSSTSSTTTARNTNHPIDCCYFTKEKKRKKYLPAEEPQNMTKSESCVEKLIV